MSKIFLGLGSYIFLYGVLFIGISPLSVMTQITAVVIWLFITFVTVALSYFIANSLCFILSVYHEIQKIARSGYKAEPTPIVDSIIDHVVYITRTPNP